MKKIMDTISYFLKPVDTSGSGVSSVDLGLIHPTATLLDVLKSLFWMTAAIAASILISSL